MQELLFKKGYQKDTILRKSFNELANKTFGINFESWYKKGQWTDKYIPYSYIVDQKVVANVSVNKVDFLIDGEEKRAIQIGTVMTDPAYRNQGLSRALMEIILEEYQMIDFIYLFANHTVLDFYPKFGFERLEESYFSMEVKEQGQYLSLKKMSPNDNEDFSFIENMVLERSALTEKFDTMNTKELFMFYCLNVFPNDIYFIEEDEALVICQIENKSLHIFDIVSKSKPDIKRIIQRIPAPGIDKVILHFTPEGLPVSSKKIQSTEDVLFVKKINEVMFPTEFKHPHTSKA